MATIMATGMARKEIAEVLGEIAVLLELQGENPFKVRAYQAGARLIEGMEEQVTRGQFSMTIQASWKAKPDWRK